jgi:hypothetical protein
MLNQIKAKAKLASNKPRVSFQAPLSPIAALNRMCECLRKYRIHQIVPVVTLLVLTTARSGLSPVHASIPGTPLISDPNVTSVAPAPGGGFWIQKQEERVCPPNCALSLPGHTFTRDGAPNYEDVYKAGSIAWAPGTNGYWVVTLRGEIFSRGGAPELCGGSLSSCSGFTPGAFKNIVAVAATPDGRGLWAVGLDGNVWPAGDATFYGDAQNNGSLATGIAATATGKGYCISISDGGVYCRGDAPYLGRSQSGGGITGIAFHFNANAEVTGYWLVADNGGIITVGNAPFWGSGGGLGHRVTSLVSFPLPSENNQHPQTVGYGWVNDSALLEVAWAPEP